MHFEKHFNNIHVCIQIHLASQNVLRSRSSGSREERENVSGINICAHAKIVVKLKANRAHRAILNCEKCFRPTSTFSAVSRKILIRPLIFIVFLRCE